MANEQTKTIGPKLGGKVAASKAKAQAADAIMKMGHPIATPVELQRSFFRSISGILRQPSLAYWKDRHLQKMMRNDPDVEAPLHDMQVSVSGLGYEIRGGDDVDDGHISFVEDAISDLKQFTDMKMQLLEAVWYGPSAVNVVWSKRDGDTVPGEWHPIHPDTLAFTMDGRLGLRVGYEYSRKHPDAELVRGFDSQIRMLSPSELDSTLLHVYRRRGPDFDDPRESAYHWAGRGVRDVAWFYWMMKQECLQNWATYCARYAMGIRIGYYQSGNAQAKTDMETVLRNLVGDVSAVLPSDGSDGKQNKIEILEPSAGRATAFADLTEWLAANIEVLIVGQRMTKGSGGTGIGSGGAAEVAKTFNRHQAYVSSCLDETITNSLVRRMIDMNFGPQRRYPQYVARVPKPDGPAIMDAAQKFVSMGGEIQADQVRGVLGLTKPEAGDEVLSQANMLPGFGTGGGLSHPNQMGMGAEPRDGDGFDRVSMKGMMGGGGKEKVKDKPRKK